MRRGDGPLTREFSIQRITEQGRIAAAELRGERQQPIGKPIPAQIKAQIAAPRCVALYTSNPECGHKGGRRDAPRLSAASRPASDDSQPLPKAATNANHQPRRNPPKNQPNVPPPTSQAPTAQRQQPSRRGSRPGRRRHDVRGLRPDAAG